MSWDWPARLIACWRIARWPRGSAMRRAGGPWPKAAGREWPNGSRTATIAPRRSRTRSRHDPPGSLAAALRLPARRRDDADAGRRPPPPRAALGGRARLLGHRPECRLVAWRGVRPGAAPRLYVAATAGG